MEASPPPLAATGAWSAPSAAPSASPASPEAPDASAGQVSRPERPSIASEGEKSERSEGERRETCCCGAHCSPTLSPAASVRSAPSPSSRKRLHTLRIQTDFSSPPATLSPSLTSRSPRPASPSRAKAAGLTLEDLLIPTSSSANDLQALSRPATPSAPAPTGSPGIGLSASMPPKRASVANAEGAASSLMNAANTPVHRPKPHPFSLADFFYKEIFGVHDVKPTDGQHQERVQNFLTVPLSTEQLFAFGVLLALDSFLYVFTYLPLRILFACGCAVSSSFRSTRVFRRTHFYDLMVAVIICVGTAVLWRVDMSRVYHAIRGQAMIKLYVLFTMIEVGDFKQYGSEFWANLFFAMQIFDKLFSSLGQDILDSLYFTAKYQPRRVVRMFCDFAVAIIYVDILFRDMLSDLRCSVAFLRTCWSDFLDFVALLHSLLLFAQVVTINVAINSSNTSLLTLLISNNFAELKV